METRDTGIVIDTKETDKDTYVPEQDNEQQETKTSFKDKAMAKARKIGKKKILVGALAIVGTAYFGPKVVKAVKTAFTAPRMAENIASATEIVQLPDDLEEATTQILEAGIATVNAANTAEQVQQVQTVAETAETIGNVVDTATAI